MKKSTRITEHGQGMVEFGMILLVLLLFLVAALDFGRVIYTSSVLHNAAREGARTGSIDPDNPAAVINAVRGMAYGIDASALTISQSFPGGNSIQVVVSYPFRASTPLMAPFLGGGSMLTLVSRATMRLEQ
jgi:hypothetical protein